MMTMNNPRMVVFTVPDVQSHPSSLGVGSIGVHVLLTVLT